MNNNDNKYSAVKEPFVFFEQLFEIHDMWEIYDVILNKDIKEIRVKVRIKKGTKFIDPATKKITPIHKWTTREWRDVDVRGSVVIIEANVPYVTYEDGSIKEVSVPWANKHSRITTFMERYVIELLTNNCNVTNVARMTNLHWRTINTIMKRAVQKGLTKRKACVIKTIAIDEKSISKGHTYTSILTDSTNGRVIDLVEGRNTQSAEQLLNHLDDNQKRDVQAISMDMWQPFMNASKNVLPNATIVHDKFHIKKYANELVDATRRKEHKELTKQGINVLNGKKFTFLKNAKHLKQEEFDAINNMNLKTSKAWIIKENFNNFFLQQDKESALAFYNTWRKDALTLDTRPVKKFLDTLDRHLTNILNYFDYRITNAISEGFNSKIQLLKHATRGLKSFDAYRTKILFYCGKLDLGI